MSGVGMGPSGSTSWAIDKRQPGATFAIAELLLLARAFREEAEHHRTMGSDEVADAYSDCAERLDGRAAKLRIGGAA